MINRGYGVELDVLRKNMSDVYQDWRNDPRVYHWCRQHDLINRAQHDKWFEKQALDPTISMYSIIQGGRTVGVCGLTSIDLIHSRAEFSLYIAPENQGQGIAKKALKTLVSTGFLDYGLNCIWAEAFEGNKAMRIYKALGFVEEGIRRDFYYKDGRFINAHLISLLRRDWSPWGLVF